MRDGLCVSLEQLAETVERAEAGLPLKQMFNGVLSKLRYEEELESFAQCVWERVCMDEVHVSYGDVGMMFVKSRLVGGGFCFSLDVCDTALNSARASLFDGCVRRMSREFMKTASI